MTEIIGMFSNEQWYDIVRGIGSLIFFAILVSPFRAAFKGPKVSHRTVYRTGEKPARAVEAPVWKSSTTKTEDK